MYTLRGIIICRENFIKIEARQNMSGVFNNFNDDTICAVATAMSDSGIGVIRVSGREAEEKSPCLDADRTEEE